MRYRSPNMRQLTGLLVLTTLFFAGCDSETATETAGNETVSPEKASDEPAAELEENAASAGKEGQVLRHAVFFSFKDSSSQEDVDGVVEAFRALPSKIDTIIDFAAGVNNSPEGKNDGFTHCFLLTFADAAGREVYLPHPEHKAFGDVLRPHMQDVFVIDYWGTAADTPLEKELKHAVFFQFREGASAEGVAAVENAFAALPSKIDAIKAFEWGTNNSPESHDDGFTHCFMLTFDSEAGRDEYLPHPDHKAFGKVLQPVRGKVRVLDFWAE